MTYLPLPDSYRSAPEGELLGSTDGGCSVEATLVLRRPVEGAQAAFSDVMAVCHMANMHGLRVTETHPLRRTVRVLGSVDQMNATFDTSLTDYRLDGRVVRCYAGDLHVFAELDGVVIAVLGLDQRFPDELDDHAATLVELDGECDIDQPPAPVLPAVPAQPFDDKLLTLLETCRAGLLQQLLTVNEAITRLTGS